jgi:hypothetical protein
VGRRRDPAGKNKNHGRDSDGAPAAAWRRAHDETVRPMCEGSLSHRCMLRKRSHDQVPATIKCEYSPRARTEHLGGRVWTARALPASALARR